jgi:hypothetical protein
VSAIKSTYATDISAVVRAYFSDQSAYISTIAATNRSTIAAAIIRTF